MEVMKFVRVPFPANPVPVAVVWLALVENVRVSGFGESSDWVARKLFTIDTVNSAASLLVAVAAPPITIAATASAMWRRCLPRCLMALPVKRDSLSIGKPVRLNNEYMIGNPSSPFRFWAIMMKIKPKPKARLSACVYTRPHSSIHVS